MSVAVGCLALLAYGLLPAPVSVDVATVTRGPMRVTIDEDGQTRIKERYVVSSPLAGQLLRVSLRPGDQVEAGQTVLAVIQPKSPELLDDRASAEARARVSAGDAAVQRAEATLARAKVDLESAQHDLKHLKSMFEKLTAAQKELDDGQFLVRLREQESRAASFALEMARFELSLAKAALPRLREASATGGDDGGAFEIRAPCAGKVLRVFQESAAVIQAGARLLELGDPSDLEMVVDVLSEQAVGVEPGARAIIGQWGGGDPLSGVVRLVEPSAFTKVSALGVEEQRVNVILDLTDPLAARQALGDGYRVAARIIRWEGDAVLRAPVSALFRQGDGWAVFAVKDGVAKATPIEVARRNDQFAPVTGGIDQGQPVVLFPGDQIAYGTWIEPRSGK